MSVLIIIALCCHHTNCLVRNPDLHIFIVKDISSLCKEVIDSLGSQLLTRYKCILVSPNKKSLFGVTGLKILGRVGTHVFFCFCFFKSGKKYNFMHFERHYAFQNA